MIEDDCGEIEYLDEDEDLVHQYVQNLTETNYENSFRDLIPSSKIPTDLPKERRVESKRKLRSEDDDSDYDPINDIILQRKKRTKINVRKKPALLKFTESESITNKFVLKASLEKSKYKSVFTKRSKSKIDLERKKSDIKIPSYEDALCLPGKAFKRDENDTKRLRNWNKLCLERLKRNDNVLKSEYGSVVKSSRAFVFRNVQNSGGRVETSMWCKSSVENAETHKKSEIFQTVVPYFREKNIVRPYQLIKAPRTNDISKFEIILTKESSKDDEYLVAYNTKDCLSAIYKSFMKDNDDTEVDEKDNRRICLKETTCCKVCAPCYQVSWRGIRKTETANNITCSVCLRTFVSVYNLLTHLKSHHTDEDVRKHKKRISDTLAKFVEYHYKCRICQEQFKGIKELRKHVVTHQGNELFHCEVGNHMAS